MTARRRLLLAALLAAPLAGCNTTGGLTHRPMSLRDLAKTDMDVVAEFHLAANLADLRELMRKLYLRNPRQWKQRGRLRPEVAAAQLFADPVGARFEQLGDRRGTDAVRLAFDAAYAGDRVLAFVQGLVTMLMAAYGDRREFFLLDELDAQKLYNAARNVEVAVWRLANARDPAGEPWLLSNSMDEGPANLSYERLFGRIVGRQDVLAEIVADRTNRTLRLVMQRMATAVFLPI